MTIRNLCVQGNAPQDVLENIQNLDEILLKCFPKKKKKRLRACYVRQ
jgi:hypothetical protein